MALLEILRTMGALAMVLGLLGGALWAVRRFDLRLPGAVGAGRSRRVELVERLALDGRRSVALIRRDGREHLILLGPEGPMLIEGGIQQRRPRASKPAEAPAPVRTPLPRSFAALVEALNSRRASAANPEIRADV
jgi:hypothetical protein